MTVFFIFLLMILGHIVDDFVLQPICLSKLKQKSWWENNAPDKKYKDDFYTALFIHGLSWTIMVHMPLMILCCVTGGQIGILFFGLILIQGLIHSYIDDIKANERLISLTTDQILHLFQIFLSLMIFLIWL